MIKVVGYLENSDLYLGLRFVKVGVIINTNCGIRHIFEKLQALLKKHSGVGCEIMTEMQIAVFPWMRMKCRRRRF